MKPIRVLLSLLMVMAILLASPVSANAIGFEAESAYASVFVVYSGNYLGSGFAIGENCIVTNAHVIADNNHITIISYDGNEFVLDTRQMREILGGIPLDLPEVAAYILDYLEENKREVDGGMAV